MKSRKQGLNKEKVFSLIISLAIILTLGYGIYSVVKNSGNKDNNNNIVNLNDTNQGDVAIKTEDGPDQLPLENGEDAEAANADATKETMEDPTEAAEDVAANAKVDPVSKYSFSSDDTLLWPVSGDVVLKYSMDTTVLFKTLNQYKVNPAVLISSDVGTNVAVAAPGVVTSVTNNEETGTTVSVAIGDGYVTTYGMLDEVVVKEGDTVSADQLLGTIAEPTAYYTMEGPALYFKLQNGEDPVDPSLFLAEQE